MQKQKTIEASGVRLAESLPRKDELRADVGQSDQRDTNSSQPSTLPRRHDAPRTRADDFVHNFIRARPFFVQFHGVSCRPSHSSFFCPLPSAPNGTNLRERAHPGRKPAIGTGGSDSAYPQDADNQAGRPSDPKGRVQHLGPRKILPHSSFDWIPMPPALPANGDKPHEWNRQDQKTVGMHCPETPLFGYSLMPSF